MRGFARTDTSLVGRWWWTVDRWLLAAIMVLIGLGLVLSLAGSPAVAERIRLEPYHFVRRHLAFLAPSLLLLFAFSMMSPLVVRRVAAMLCLALIGALVSVLLVGADINGAKRWIALGAFSFQPAEFIKPTFAVVAAWMLAEAGKSPGFPGRQICIVLFAAIVSLVALQPDFGQATLISAVWLAQFFLAGLAWIWVVALAGIGVLALFGAYFAMPHVASRVDRFLDPSSGDTYQIATAMNAFRTGGLFGRGPGEGVVKGRLPDAHTDFIFAVAGEEFGLIACTALLGLFAFIVLRGLILLQREDDRFAFLATAGILIQFGLQAVINMAVNLNLMPAKGMTLPFISYGGSSLMSLALGMGMVLALTRRQRAARPRLLPWRGGGKPGFAGGAA